MVESDELVMRWEVKNRKGAKVKHMFGRSKRSWALCISVTLAVAYACIQVILARRRNETIEGGAFALLYGVGFGLGSFVSTLFANLISMHVAARQLELRIFQHQLLQWRGDFRSAFNRLRRLKLRIELTSCRFERYFISHIIIYVSELSILVIIWIAILTDEKSVDDKLACYLCFTKDAEPFSPNNLITVSEIIFSIIVTFNMILPAYYAAQLSTESNRFVRFITGYMLGPLNEDGSDSDDDEDAEKSYFDVASGDCDRHLFQDTELLSRFLVLAKETELSLTIYGIRITPLWSVAASAPTILFALYRIISD